MKHPCVLPEGQAADFPLPVSNLARLPAVVDKTHWTSSGDHGFYHRDLALFEFKI